MCVLGFSPANKALHKVIHIACVIFFKNIHQREHRNSTQFPPDNTSISAVTRGSFEIRL